jgi:hypothetical protein
MEQHVGLTELLTQLKIMSMIRQHERFSTTRGIRIEPEGKFQPLWRWLFGEARDQNIIELTKIVHRAIATLQAMQTTADASAIRQLRAEMAGAKIGLLNLKTTYEGDSVMVAKLQLLCDSIDATMMDDEGS